MQPDLSSSDANHHSGPHTSNFPTAIYPTESTHFQILRSVPLLSAPKQNLADVRIYYVKTLGPRSESRAKHAVGAEWKRLWCVLIWTHEPRLFTVSKTCPVLSKGKIKQGTRVTQITQQAVQPSEIILHCIPKTFQGHDVICGFLSGF